MTKNTKNTTKPSPSIAPKQKQQEQPKEFIVKAEGLTEIVQCINEVSIGKYAKQVIFTALNANLKPVEPAK